MIYVCFDWSETLGKKGSKTDVTNARNMNVEELREAYLMPRTMELLYLLIEEGATLGIIANTDVNKHYFMRMLRKLAIDHYFSLVVVSNKTNGFKPEKRIFDVARRGFGNPDSRRLFFVGNDAETDLAGARGAGWRAYSIRWTPRQLLFFFKQQKNVVDLSE